MSISSGSIRRPPLPPLHCAVPHRSMYSTLSSYTWGAFQRPLTVILLQKYRDTNGRRIVIQIGGVYTTFCQPEGILLQKYRDRNGRCIAIHFKSIGVRGRFDFPEYPSQRGKHSCHSHALVWESPGFGCFQLLFPGLVRCERVLCFMGREVTRS